MFRRFLLNTPALVLASILLIVPAGLEVWAFYPDFASWTRILLQRHDPRADLWRRWATHYDGLFGMLPPPASVGIQYQGEHAAGVSLQKSQAGFTASSRFVLAQSHPGVVFTLDEGARQQLLNGFESRSPEDIWALMKSGLYAGHIHIWNDTDMDRLHRGGYLLLMRAIDTHPDELDWKTVKQMLGEPAN